MATEEGYSTEAIFFLPPLHWQLQSNSLHLPSIPFKSPATCKNPALHITRAAPNLHPMRALQILQSILEVA